MANCRRCSARVPDGRYFCHVHYEEALISYQEEMDAYERRIARWDRLTARERAQAHRAAENEQIGIYSEKGNRDGGS